MPAWEQTGKTRWRYGDVKVSQRSLKSGFFVWVSRYPDGRERRHRDLDEAKAHVEEQEQKPEPVTIDYQQKYVGW